MAKRQKTFSEQLREAILAAEKTRYRISKETGITEAGLSRFVNGVAGLSLDTVDKVCECLGLELTAPTRSKRKIR